MPASFITCRLPTVALLCSVFAVSLFGAACNRSESEASAKENANADTLAKETAPILVTTATAVEREVPSFIQATGSLVADETSDVAPQTSGQIIATPVDVGAFVRTGDAIARLNDSDARLRLRQAEVSVQQAITGVRQAEAGLGLQPGGNFDASSIPAVRAANANYEQVLAELRQAEQNERRYRDLVETGDVSMGIYEGYRTQRDTARARLNNARQQQEAAINAARQSSQAVKGAQDAVEAARAQVAIAQKAVTDSIVRAPYPGYISSRPIALGEYVTPASIVATLLRTNPIKLQLQVPETDAPFITPGMSVSLEVEAYGNRKFAGQVTAINPAIDPVSRSVTIEAAVENGENALRSGMFAIAQILRRAGSRGVFVARAAVLSDQNTQSYRVFVIQGDTAKLRVVQLGSEEGEMVQILSGVNPDETIATDNLQQLFEGARVRTQ